MGTTYFNKSHFYHWWSFLLLVSVAVPSVVSHFVPIQTFISLKFHSLYKTQTHFRSEKIALPCINVQC